MSEEGKGRGREGGSATCRWDIRGHYPGHLDTTRPPPPKEYRRGITTPTRLLRLAGSSVSPIAGNIIAATLTIIPYQQKPYIYTYFTVKGNYYTYFTVKENYNIEEETKNKIRQQHFNSKNLRIGFFFSIFTQMTDTIHSLRIS